MGRFKKLRRVSDSHPGMRRERRGDGFVYMDADGREISDPEILTRIRSLAIPPAYTDVWICPHEDGHIQATGRDARGRKQYRYHPEWRCLRDATKFGRLLAFGHALPAIRARVAEDIQLSGLPRAKVLATIVRLLEITLIRVGNDGYAKSNNSYGLTTLRDQHVSIKGSTIAFSFRGKGGIGHRISVRDRRLAKIVERSRDLPGDELFQYVDKRHRVHDVTSDDVNGYLRACCDDYFTAKDFRTWAGTVLCFKELSTTGPVQSVAAAKRCVNRAVEKVASRLGNTPAVCRKSYIHPGVIAAYMDGTLSDWRAQYPGEPTFSEGAGLNDDERSMLSFLEEACLA
jgi:DNA topoisomerase I